MDKVRSMLKYIVGMNFAHILVVGLLVKALISDVSYATFLLTIPILAYEGYRLFLKSKKPDPIHFDQELRKELDNIKAKISAGQIDQSMKKPMQRYF